MLSDGQSGTLCLSRILQQFLFFRSFLSTECNWLLLNWPNIYFPSFAHQRLSTSTFAHTGLFFCFCQLNTFPDTYRHEKSTWFFTQISDRLFRVSWSVYCAVHVKKVVAPKYYSGYKNLSSCRLLSDLSNSKAASRDGLQLAGPKVPPSSSVRTDLSTRLCKDSIVVWKKSRSFSAWPTKGFKIL